jgi:hypothetical protein
MHRTDLMLAAIVVDETATACGHSFACNASRFLAVARGRRRRRR